MAIFLTTSHTSAAIEDIIKEARGKLVLVSPYWQLSPNLIRRLQAAAEKGVETTVIYREGEAKTRGK